MNIFNIPIYRTSIDKFEEELKKDKLKKEDFKQIDWNYVERMNYILDTLWFPWKFNEIIGYIRISLTRTDIEGALYLGNYKRIRRNYQNRKIKYQNTLFRINYTSLRKSTEIFEILKKEIEKIVKQEHSLKNRYVDIDSYESIAKYIDWQKVIQDNNTKKIMTPTEFLNDIADSPNSRMIYFGEEVKTQKYYDKNTDIDELLKKAQSKEKENRNELSGNAKSFLKELNAENPMKFKELMLILRERMKR